VPPILDDIALLGRLVAFDSVSRNSPLPLAGFICDYLDLPGVRVSRNLSDDGTRANLVIEVGPPGDPHRRGGLVLSGHLDVVPADEPEWTSDPFMLTRLGDRLYGRGSADMKGFLALAMNRFRDAAGRSLRHPLVLLFTYDEELGTLGAKRFVETFDGLDRLPSQVIIGEPTSLRPARMHKGHLKMQLVVRGMSAHSGYPHLGHNAIEPAARAVAALGRLRRELEAERPPAAGQFPEVPFITLNVAQVRGGVAVNVVPDRCQVDIGARILPGMRSAELVARIWTAVGPALSGEDFTLEVTGDSPPYLLADGNPLCRRLVESQESEGRRGGESVSFATDAGWLGTAGFECVIFGPGTIEVAHKPNEFVPVPELQRATAILEREVRRACLEQVG
jgi:acetylornithine deacetylase